MELALRSRHVFAFLRLIILVSTVNGSAIAQPHLSSDAYEFDIHPRNSAACSSETNSLAFEIRDGAVKLSYLRGGLASAKISPDRSVMKIAIGSEDCRFSILMSRLESEHDIHALLTQNNDSWEDAPAVVRLARAGAGCVHFSYAASLLLNTLTVHVSYDSNELEASPNNAREGIGQGDCLIRATSSRFY